jgi:hypothetical protein
MSSPQQDTAPESGGKGSFPRAHYPGRTERYRSGYEAINWSKKPEPTDQVTAHCESCGFEHTQERSRFMHPQVRHLFFETCPECNSEEAEFVNDYGRRDCFDADGNHISEQVVNDYRDQKLVEWENSLRQTHQQTKSETEEV